MSGGICEKRVAAKVKGSIGGSEISNVVWFGDGGTEQKSGGKTGGGRVKDVEILFEIDEDGQDQEQAHQEESTGQMFWKQSWRGQIEMVWICAEEGQRIEWQRDAQDGAPR